MNHPPARGLPPRIYLPILAIIAILFLGVMFYLLNTGFRVTGSAFGTSASTPAPHKAHVPQNEPAQDDWGFDDDWVSMMTGFR
ncbi:MAG: hypothetical protein ACREML_08240 [Vulcanimicrobiaceae bacterium]